MSRARRRVLNTSIAAAASLGSLGAAAWLAPAAPEWAAAGWVLLGRGLAYRLIRIDRQGWGLFGPSEAAVRALAVFCGSLLAGLLWATAGAGASPLFFLIEALAHFALVEAANGAAAMRKPAGGPRRFASRTALLYGAGRGGRRLLEELRAKPALGVRPLGFLDDDPERVETSVDGAPVLGRLDELPRLAELHAVDELLVAIPRLPEERRDRVVELARHAGIRCRFLPTLEETVADALDPTGARTRP